ncbi:acetylcholinesterase-like isoform X3 [Dermacentor variabilis]|uniref:acetylcholinesterase-like isoform X3 n=1 Tax=Dermacentor variabilis TaxID=34621 RepID=UPI003F5C4DE4
MGFFKPDSSDVVYDVAFKDLQLAVDWTRRNAAALDGDPEALMALGRGSGAFMLATTMISREHHVGFRRMLLQGLYPTMPLSLNTPSMGRGYMNSMARFLGCESGDPSELLSCLKEAPQERLLKAARHIDIPLRFVPARFEGYSVGDISDHDVWKFDADVDIILGSALSLGEEFNDEYLLPYAASLKSAYDPERFLRSVCFFLKYSAASEERPSVAGVRARRCVAQRPVAKLQRGDHRAGRQRDMRQDAGVRPLFVLNVAAIPRNAATFVGYAGSRRACACQRP